MTGLSLQPAHATTSLAWPTSDCKYVGTIKRTSEACVAGKYVLDRLERAAKKRGICNRRDVGGGEIAGVGEMKGFLLKREAPYNQPKIIDTMSQR